MSVRDKYVKDKKFKELKHLFQIMMIAINRGYPLKDSTVKTYEKNLKQLKGNNELIKILLSIL